eukprot:CAMPEP_0171974848 /NCGR_PEP_ID=MMETSP0993-20121228/234414_1 /TAXON_ID=483369 /ORGANISM="non described non described, Strain CCMP2098" /LENGTH=160 /DNA_ID=CAMNT_0012625959 /DNA_START=139 /DNA_END=621 /DNA_ORIENTATION=-
MMRSTSPPHNPLSASNGTEIGEFLVCSEMRPWRRWAISSRESKTEKLNLGTSTTKPSPSPPKEMVTFSSRVRVDGKGDGGNGEEAWFLSKQRLSRTGAELTRGQGVEVVSWPMRAKAGHPVLAYPRKVSAAAARASQSVPPPRRTETSTRFAAISGRRAG